MSKNGGPPAYGFIPPPSAPPSYAQAVGGVQPQGQYVPQHAVDGTTTIVTTVIPIGAESTHTICPNCHAEIATRTKKEPGLIAYISGVVIALLGCWLGCCLIPCCIDECMDVHHSCPNCNAHLGRYRR